MEREKLHITYGNLYQFISRLMVYDLEVIVAPNFYGVRKGASYLKHLKDPSLNGG